MASFPAVPQVLSIFMGMSLSKWEGFGGDVLANHYQTFKALQLFFYQLPKYKTTTKSSLLFLLGAEWPNVISEYLLSAC